MIPWILCGILLVIVIMLVIKIAYLQKSMDEICAEFKEHLSVDTNTLISISSNDPRVKKLASEINIQLRKLRRQRHRYVQGDTELKSAVTNISHDLRTPLTAINGYLDLLEKTQKDADAERYLDVIRGRAEVLKQLTEELFRYSVITSPEYDTSAELVSVNAVLEESILGFYAALQERNITPEIHMTEEKVLRSLNRAALSRVFSNLLSNALKYCDGNLEITLTSEGKVIFSNMAPELSEVEVERLFDRFYTVENARKGTGLGLSIARTLTEQMGGTITAEYAEGRFEVCVFFLK